MSAAQQPTSPHGSSNHRLSEGTLNGLPQPTEVHHPRAEKSPSIAPDLECRQFFIDSTLQLSAREMVDMLAEFCLAGTGRRRCIRDFIDSAPRMRRMAELYVQYIEPSHGDLLGERILRHGLTSSIPLIGLRTSPLQGSEDMSWGARCRFDLGFMRRCPNAIGRSNEDLLRLQQRAARIEWHRVGEVLEGAIRSRLGLSSSVALSICIFGGFLWKDSPGDIDMLVVVEDLAYKKLTIGRPTLHAAGLREFMPAECRPRSDMVELCVIGLGALEEGQHLRDVTDVLVPPTTDGLWVKGKPLIDDICDLTLAQTWLSFLGNGVQESAMDPSFAPKAASMIPYARKLLLHSMRKYGLPEATMLEEQLRQESAPQDAAELVKAYVELRVPCERLISAVRSRCAEVTREYIRALRPEVSAHKLPPH